MSGSAKVVPLKPENSDAIRRAQMARLPAPVHHLREKGKQLLLGLLRTLFDNADDALFDLADKATSNHEQNLYFDSMREVRIRRRAMEIQFAESIDKAFARLTTSGAAADSADSREDISFDNLSLVQNEELEQLVATDSMIAKATEQCAESIQHLTLRIDSLVPLKVYQKNNPLGPDVICYAFIDAAKTLAIDIKAKLVLFKLFDKYVIAELGMFYSAANALLVEHGILPSLKQEGRRSGSQHRARNSEAPPVGASAHPGSQAAVENEVLHTLRELLAEQRGVQPAAPAQAGAVLGAGDLIGLLSNLQTRQYGSPVAGFESSLLPELEIRQLLNQLLQQSNRQQKIGQVDEDVINLVNMMFEFILDDRNLAEPMKAIIGRLQIPIIKVAIADKAFFNRGGHPARRLLNELATAALGWQDDGKRQDPLYKKIESVVQRLLGEFVSNIDIFNELLADFISFVEEEKRRASILEQRTVDAEDGKAKTEAARMQVAQALQARLPAEPLPPVIEKLLREAWSNVLFLICLKQGTGSADWQEGLQTTEDLVWSVTAPQDKDSRQKMLTLVPDLLKRLRIGLESVSYNPYEMTQLFKQLEELHIAKLRSQAKPVAPEPQTVVPAQPESAEMAQQTAVTTSSIERIADEPVRAQSSIYQARQEAAAGALSKEAGGGELAISENLPSSAPEQTASVSELSEVPELDGSVDTDVSGKIPEAVDVRASAALTSVAKEDTAPAESKPSNVGRNATASTEPVMEETLAEGDAFLLKVDKLTQGTWFEMAEGQQSFRCRLAAIIKPTGKYIFVNRSGVKVAEKTRNSLAVALKSGALVLLDDGMLFDRALEAVIGNLRSSRSGGSR